MAIALTLSTLVNTDWTRCDDVIAVVDVDELMITRTTAVCGCCLTWLDFDIQPPTFEGNVVAVAVEWT